MINEDYYYTRKFKKLLKKYESCEHEQEKWVFSSDEYISLATYFFSSEKNEKALTVLNKGLDLYPGSDEMFVLKAHVLLKLKKGTEEIRTMLEGHKIADDFQYSYVSSFLMIAEKRYEEACNTFKQVYHEMIVHQEDKDAQVIRIASLFHDVGQDEYARYWLGKVENCDDENYLDLHGEIILREGKYKEAEKVYKKLIGKNPHVARYWRGLAHCQYGNGNFSEASTNCDFALAIDPEDDIALFLKGNIMSMMYNFPEALKFFKRYSERHPEDGGSLYYQGECLLRMEKKNEALETLLESSRLLEKYPEYQAAFPISSVYCDIAYLLEDRGQHEEALSYIEKCDNRINIKEMMRNQPYMKELLAMAQRIKNNIIDNQ